jgi:hypothetical protein
MRGRKPMGRIRPMSSPAVMEQVISNDMFLFQNIQWGAGVPFRNMEIRM